MNLGVKIPTKIEKPFKYLFELYTIKGIVSFFPNITLKWLIEIYECIHYLSPLFSLSEASKNLTDLLYSKEKFESIKKSFSEIELNSTLNNLDSREEIKQMYKILTRASHVNPMDYQIEYLKIALNSFEHSDSDYEPDSDSELFHIVRSVEAFDVLYDTLKFRLEIKDILNRFFELQRDNIPSSGDYIVNDLILISILNHFKTKYPEDYNSQCSKLDFKENKKLFSNDFICNNYQDFKENILKCNESYENKKKKTIKEGCGYWATYFKNIGTLFDYRYPVSKYLKLNQFITILESTPPQQKYSCLSNPEILAWIYENRECDLKSGRCIQPNNITLFRYLFYTNQLSKALNDIDYLNNPGELDPGNDQKTNVPIRVIKAMKSKKQLKQKQFNEFNTIIKIKLLLSDRSVKLLKTIVKSNNFNYLEILYNFINNISKEKKFKDLLEELKDSIFCLIKKYNKISCFKLLLKLDQDNKSFFSADLLIFFYKEINTNCSINQEISNILKINFNINIEDKIKEDKIKEDKIKEDKIREGDEDEDGKEEDGMRMKKKMKME
ncbi:hypothetical protein ACTFIR_007116 [Dictyostelium discoideum]